MELYPPDDPYVFRVVLFNLPLEVRWYGVLIMTGVLLAAWLSSWRAKQRGYDPEHVWNQLMLGLVLGIIGARLYYVAFEWDRFGGNPLAILNITTGGLAIHGAIIGAVLAAIIYTRRHKIPFWDWMDTCMPGFLLAQAVGRWGNFFNQEAYGRPTTLGFGVRIDPEYRQPPYNDMQLYPPNTLFHATFLYESVWNLIGVGLLLLADRRFGRLAPPPQRWLRQGDILFFYAIYYSLGRFWIEGLRTDSLYLGPLRVAQVVSLSLVILGIVALIINHLRPLSNAELAANSPVGDSEPGVLEDTPGAGAEAQSDASTHGPHRVQSRTAEETPQK